MRIGIDMRMAGTGEGIGRYCEELVKNLAEIDKVNEYYLIFNDHTTSLKFKFKNEKFKNIIVKSKYYSWMEQTFFIYELSKLNLDLMHFTNFNIPVFYQRPFVVTIHDLIHHRFPGRKKSRYLHRVAYRTVIWTAIKRAETIITVSEATKNEVVNIFSIDPKKVKVIYEGAKALLAVTANSEQILKRYDITKPFLLFVGVWRQYKNLPRLAAAFDILKRRHNVDAHLVLVGKIDPFYPEIREAVFKIQNHHGIRALGFVPDDDLSALYSKAKIFVLPSLTEGFGLIGLEAQAAGLPVVASDITVLKEVLADGAVYFDPRSADDMAAKIFEIWNDPAAAQSLASTGAANASRFDWQKCARETLALYRQAI
ncbi:MAG: hypothetical protein A2751_04550 [Candidatus Doudnabacteria bacterium RIFCSPHIGHO2_01_FULL_46_14]|uniref:Glycosyl transferase family 1 n=1 Tax=Candidatus Doudnabacteria bacterium RIFCSPHIGHO2_01_FULL_46_14 TaxID=1817824 RepID=A0A1F5NNY1_9BACT|nr:MAG: hypothetical protein A2751_04550 [Candidatus Doudnabacteria bacterium RIFCSPHIGHO2_01_FULL_46_14]